MWPLTWRAKLDQLTHDWHYGGIAPGGAAGREIAEGASFLLWHQRSDSGTFGLSRDDSGAFLETYVNQDIFEKDPFVTIDQEGWANWFIWLRSVAAPP